MSAMAGRDDRLIAGLARAGAARVLPGEALARRTTFRIGGPARLWVEIADAGALGRVRDFLEGQGVPWRILGGGSNVLAPDAGYPGAVVRLTGGLAAHALEGTRLTAGAGASMGALAAAARAAGLAGLESVGTLPGTLGGALAGNAGYAGRAIGELVESVTVLGADGAIAVLPAAAITFQYRRSSLRGGVILGATLGLAPGDREAIARAAESCAAERRARQPLSLPSAGCVFRNPPGAAAKALIERAGAKGWTESGAAVSAVHANFIVNEGGARAADVRRLIERVRARVLERFGIALECEIEIMAGDE